MAAKTTTFKGYGKLINDLTAVQASDATIIEALEAAGCKNGKNKLTAHKTWLKGRGAGTQQTGTYMRSGQQVVPC